MLASPLTAPEARGKHVYVSGEGADGKPIKAFVGKDSTELPGTSVPCIGCHGEDGQGRQEGGLKSTDITFEHLTLSYGHRHESGRKHPAFTSNSIIEAVSRGIDPAGNPLDSTMPRYELSGTEKDDLIAYLKRLSTDLDPGLTDTIIRIGTVLPTQGELSSIGLAMKKMLSAYVDKVNAQGGIYNRKLQLVIAEINRNDETSVNNIRHLFERERVLAIVAPFSGNQARDRGIRLLSEKRMVPVIGPYTLFPEEDPGHSQWLFYLLPGLNNESRAMVDYAADVLHLKNVQSIVLNPKNVDLNKAAEALDKQGQIRGLGRISHFTYPQGHLQQTDFAEKLKTYAPDVIFFLGSDNDLRSLQPALSAMTPQPYLFVSGSLTTRAHSIDENYRNKIFLSFPALSNQQSQADEFSQLIKQNTHSTEHLMAQALSYSAARLLTEGLKKIGREVSRKKLIEALEHTYQFDSALMPRQSFGPNRHIGSTEVDIVSAQLLTQANQ